MMPAAALLSLTLTISAFFVLWLISLRTRNAAIADVYWGPGFVVITSVTLITNGTFGTNQIAFASLVGLWGLRLGFHLWFRHRAAHSEDRRYALMRASAIAAPGLMGRVGILIFAMGITLETMADAALMRFKRKAENKGRLLTRGLFAWSRHPNYLGEALIWTGLALFAYSTSGAAIVFLSPVLLTFLIIRVSGIPPLEAILGERDGFNEWKARTNAFIPWPPKRS